jgi:hypothetical protein
MLRINIRQQNAKLELSIKDPAISLRPRAARLELHTEPAVVEIRQPQGTLEIDQSPCRASYGIKKLDQFTRDITAKSRRIVQEAIGKIAADGDRMARIESKENVIKALALEAGRPEPVEVVLQPVAPPHIRYYPRRPEYNVQQGKIAAQYTRGTVDVQLDRGVVNVSMGQYPSIRMWTTGTFDFSV